MWFVPDVGRREAEATRGVARERSGAVLMGEDELSVVDAPVGVVTDPSGRWPRVMVWPVRHRSCGVCGISSVDVPLFAVGDGRWVCGPLRCGRKDETVAEVTKAQVRESVVDRLRALVSLVDGACGYDPDEWIVDATMAMEAAARLLEGE